MNLGVFLSKWLAIFGIVWPVYNGWWQEDDVEPSIGGLNLGLMKYQMDLP